MSFEPGLRAALREPKIVLLDSPIGREMIISKSMHSFIESPGCQNVRLCFWRARSRLYLNRGVQVNVHFAGFLEIHTICDLHFSNIFKVSIN